MMQSEAATLPTGYFTDASNPQTCPERQVDMSETAANASD
jgi:hypothetical protein